jgi:hypothetical protein
MGTWKCIMRIVRQEQQQAPGRNPLQGAAVTAEPPMTAEPLQPGDEANVGAAQVPKTALSSDV